MLNPKNVANAIKKAMKTPEERRQAAEQQRSQQLRIAKNRLSYHVVKQKDMLIRLTLLAKRAISLNDDANFKKIGRQIIWTKNDIQRWERYMLSLEMLEARYDQVRASVELLTAVKSMTDSLSDAAAPEKIGELQSNLEQGLAKAANLEQQMGMMMELMDNTLAGDMKVDSSELSDLQMTLTGEVAQQESSAFDPEIEELRQKNRWWLVDE